MASNSNAQESQRKASIYGQVGFASPNGERLGALYRPGTSFKVGIFAPSKNIGIDLSYSMLDLSGDKRVAIRRGFLSDRVIDSEVFNAEIKKIGIGFRGRKELSDIVAVYAGAGFVRTDFTESYDSVELVRDPDYGWVEETEKIEEGRIANGGYFRGGVELGARSRFSFYVQVDVDTSKIDGDKEKEIGTTEISAGVSINI